MTYRAASHFEEDERLKRELDAYKAEVEDYRRAIELHRQRTFQVQAAPLGVEYKLAWRAATESMSRAILEANAERNGDAGILSDD